jgi:hypothetical protein
MTRNKTLAIWLALFGGVMGLHRFYLYGQRDALGWMLPMLGGAGLYGVWRAQTYGVDDGISWMLIPLGGFAFAGCALTVLVYGLMERQRWNKRFNPGQAADSLAGRTTWLTVAALVLAMLLGTTALVASIVLTAQHVFELQQP